MLGTSQEGGAEGKMDLSWTAMARSPFYLSLRVAGADPSTVYLTSELSRDLLWKIFLIVKTLTPLYQAQLVTDQEKGMKINLGQCLYTSLCAGRAPTGTFPGAAQLRVSGLNFLTTHLHTEGNTNLFTNNVGPVGPW